MNNLLRIIKTDEFKLNDVGKYLWAGFYIRYTYDSAIITHEWYFRDPSRGYSYQLCVESQSIELDKLAGDNSNQKI